MLAVRKMQDIKSEVIKFPTNKLEEYLKNYDIAKDSFDYQGELSLINRQILNEYCDDKQSYAERLVIDDEYVGYTFDNLDEIRKVLNRK